MGVGVPSCETCTPSYATWDDSSPDEDATVKGWVVSVSWDAEPDIGLEAAAARSCALRSAPSTIWEPDGWLA